MKTVNFTLFALVLATKVFAAEVIELGISNSIESKVLTETRPYHVYLPPSYQSSDNSYPVIYLLDGDINRFKGFVGAVEALSTPTLENQVQQAIVVAIPNTNRARDLTPSELEEWIFKGRVLESFDETGGASQLSQFLQNELIPQIESTYRASNKRVLVGESFGGLYSAYTLIHNQSLFSDYLIIDPTAVWDNDYLNRVLVPKLNGTKVNANVFFAFANNSHIGELGKTNYQWGSTFASTVISLVGESSHASQQYFESERHGTVAFLAWYNGLKTLLPSNQQ